MKRRKFIQRTSQTILSAGLLGSLSSCSQLLDEEEALSLDTAIPESLFFDISLAEWSLHKTLWSGEMDHLEFPGMARRLFGIGAVEYVNQFFMDKAKDHMYLHEMKTRADDHGVRSLIIMVDMEGSLGMLEEKKRLQAINNHYKWIEAAAYLGCHSIRVNAAGKGDRKAVAMAITDSLGRLCEYAEKDNISVIVENHGGFSSDADWLNNIMQQVNRSNCGTLPDFGNFTVNLFPPIFYDREEGMKKLMPFAKGVSAKSKDFDKNIRNHPADFETMLRIVKDSGFQGHIGIEYEGYKMSEKAGIKATKHLLVQAGSKIQQS